MTGIITALTIIVISTIGLIAVLIALITQDQLSQEQIKSAHYKDRFYRALNEANQSYLLGCRDGRADQLRDKEGSAER